LRLITYGANEKGQFELTPRLALLLISFPQTHTSPIHLYSEINLRSRPSNIGSPVMSVDRILLINIDLKKPIMLSAPIVLISASQPQLQSFCRHGIHSRIQLLQIVLYKPLLSDLSKGIACVCVRDEVALAF
jgi:hypothetical protein